MKWYRLDGHKAILCSSLEEVAQYYDKTSRIVKQETIGKYFISTVFLGLDHQFGLGDPLLFETMIFEDHKNDIYQERCSTWEQAEEMHNEAIKWLKHEINPNQGSEQ